MLTRKPVPHARASNWKTRATRRPSVPEIPEELYTACPVCKAMSAADELRKNASVCPKCGHHFRISARRRVELFCDEGTFEEMWTDAARREPHRLSRLRQKARRMPANSPARSRPWSPANAAIGGEPPAPFVMEPSFMMGSMGTAVGEKITRLFEYARGEEPARGRLLRLGRRAHAGGHPLPDADGQDQRRGQAPLATRATSIIAVLTDPTTGGVDASFAMEGDIIHRRAERPHRLCRPARHRADHPPEAGRTASSARNSCWKRALWI